MQERFCDVGRGMTLCYEQFGDPDDPPLLLIMGLAMQMVSWHEDFCRQLAARGLRVVRFDNRDVGRSTHLRVRPPALRHLAARAVFRSRRAPYTLADMAQDAVGLLDALELAPAHVVGASMGGMIAQVLAARHPRAVRSLVSIMANTGSRFSGLPSPRILPIALRHPPAGRDAFIAHADWMFALLGSTGVPREGADVRAIAAASYDRDRDLDGPERQLTAIIASGDRTAELASIRAPTLVIHGTADPLVAFSGARATARAIGGARLLAVEGMGHDLPRAVWPRLIDAIVAHAAAADQPAAGGPRPPARPTSSLGPPA
jgi:pimeloyl-ACP methyl ester carboxylesterase